MRIDGTVEHACERWGLMGQWNVHVSGGDVLVGRVCTLGYLPNGLMVGRCGCRATGLAAQSMCLRTVWESPGPQGGWARTWAQIDGHDCATTAEATTEAGLEGGSGGLGPGEKEGLHMGTCGRPAWSIVPGACPCGICTNINSPPEPWDRQCLGNRLC